MAGADLARARAGKKTKTGMSEEQLEDFARKPKKKLPPKRKRGSGELTPLGQRIMQGFESRFGSEGHGRFEKALSDGRLERDKIFKRSTGGQFSARTG
jgi:hypothetical protein